MKSGGNEKNNIFVNFVDKQEAKLMNSRKKTTSYQRYFEGYTEYKEPANNKYGFKVSRIYTAPYYVHDMEDRLWIRQKVIYGVLTALAVGLYMAAAVFSRGLAEKYVALASGISAFGLVCSAYMAIVYIACRRKMRIFDYNSNTKNLKRWTLLSSWALSVTAVMTLISLLVRRAEDGMTDLWCALSYLLSAACVFAVYRIEKKTEYCEVPNDTRIPFFPDADF